MKTIHFSVFLCGMSEELFADNIMIYKPFSCYEKTYYIHDEELLDIRISELITRFKADANNNNVLDDWGKENLQLSTVYIRTKDALLGLQDDKCLSEVYAYFACNDLEFVYICVLGGASFWCDGYRFIVHPREENHRHHPHVHVKRDNNETRYSLDTLTRFPDDTFCRDFKRDEKKVILPYLQKNQAKLRKYWDYYMNGYIPPMEDAAGRQYYKES